VPGSGSLPFAAVPARAATTSSRRPVLRGLRGSVVAAVAAVVVLTVALTPPLLQNYWLGHLDSGYAVQMVDATASTGMPRVHGELFDALRQAIERPAAEVCGAPLRPPHGDVNQFKRHAYLILYALAPPAWVVGAKASVTIATALAFAALAVLAGLLAWFLSRRLVAVVAATLITVAHPAWSLSLFGQLYIDRLYLPLGFAFTALLWLALARDRPVTRRELLGLVALGLVAASVSERATLTTGVVAAVTIALHPRAARDKGLLVPFAAFAAGSVALFFFYINVVFAFSDYTSLFDSIRHFPDRVLHDGAFRESLATYLAVNLPLVALAAGWSWRAVLLALVVLGPNAVGDIGGGEKTGWVTHYHAIYYPVLVALATMGLGRMLAAAPGERAWRPWARRLAVPVALGLSAFWVLFNVYGPAKSANSHGLREQGLVQAAAYYYGDAKADGRAAQADAMRDLDAAVPKDAEVTAPEGLMPALVLHDRLVHYYPLGIKESDYAVTYYADQPDGTRRATGAFSYISPEVAAQQDECLTRRLAGEGYDMAHPQIVGGAAIWRHANPLPKPAG
jgi:hypothetical protein